MNKTVCPECRNTVSQKNQKVNRKQTWDETYYIGAQIRNSYKRISNNCMFTSLVSNKRLYHMRLFTLYAKETYDKTASNGCIVNM